MYVHYVHVNCLQRDGVLFASESDYAPHSGPNGSVLYDELYGDYATLDSYRVERQKVSAHHA